MELPLLVKAVGQGQVCFLETVFIDSPPAVGGCIQGWPDFSIVNFLGPESILEETIKDTTSLNFHCTLGLVVSVSFWLSVYLWQTDSQPHFIWLSPFISFLWDFPLCSKFSFFPSAVQSPPSLGAAYLPATFDLDYPLVEVKVEVFFTNPFGKRTGRKRQSTVFFLQVFELSTFYALILSWILAWVLRSGTWASFSPSPGWAANSWEKVNFPFTESMMNMIFGLLWLAFK